MKRTMAIVNPISQCDTSSILLGPIYGTKHVLQCSELHCEVKLLVPIEQVSCGGAEFFQTLFSDAKAEITE